MEQDDTDNIDKEIQEDKEDAEELQNNQANWFASIRSKLEASNQQLASKIERSNKKLEERFQTSNRFIGSKFQEGLGTIQEGFGSIAAAPGLAANTIRQQHNTRIELKEKLDSEHWKHTRKLLTKFECLDYTTIYNKSFRTELYLKFFNVVGDYEWLRWILSFFIGAFIGFLAWSSKTIIKAITTKKFELIQEQMNKDTAAYYFLAYCMYTFFNIAVAVLGSIIAVYFEPTAAGSGIPEVKAYLNGTKVPRFLRLRTLIAKYTSMVLANLAGLPLGAEGPMIHMGALTGNAISQAQSKELGFKIKWINHFRNDRDKRDFITSGAGAGVAAAFGAPLGGTLFSLEEVSSFWSTTLTWRTFFTCMIAVLTNEFLLTAQGSSGLIIFDLGAHELTYHISQTLPIAIIGVIGGLLGAGFTVFNMAVNRMRGKRINIKPKFRVLELVGITLVLSTIQYGLPFIFGCKDVPNACIEDIGMERTTNTTESFDCEILRQHHCPENQYSDLASIVFNTNEHMIINLLRVNMPHLLSFVSIGLFFVLYTIGAAYTAGCGIASGLFVPMVVIGAAYGRFVGLGIVNVIGLGDPGFYAIMGTAAFMAGLSRLSVSLCVIIIEITNDLQNLLPIMLVVFIAKLVADYITHPMFDSQIEAKHIPFLEPDPAKEMKILMSKHIMAKKVKFLCEKDTVENILNLLTNTTHNGFPVVNNEIERQVKGIILRPQLLVLLERKSKLWMSQSDIVYSHQEYQTKLAWNLPELATIIDAFGDEDYQHVIDLSPYMNITVYSVNEEFAVSEAFKMFRTMGLRHLLVVNDHNKVKGMITKKDLMEHSCKEKYKQLKTLKKKNLDLDLEETMIDTVPGTPAEPHYEQEHEQEEFEMGIELEEQEEEIEGKGKGKGKGKKMKKNTSSASLLTHDVLSDNNNNNNEL